MISKGIDAILGATKRILAENKSKLIQDAMTLVHSVMQSSLRSGSNTLFDLLVDIFYNALHQTTHTDVAITVCLSAANIFVGNLKSFIYYNIS